MTMKAKAASSTKKLNIKEKLDDDNLDLSLCSLELVPVKEIVNYKFIKIKFFLRVGITSTLPCYIYRLLTKLGYYL